MSLVAGYVAFWRIEAAQDARLYKELTDIATAIGRYQADMGTFYVFTLVKNPDDTDSHHDLEALWDINLVKPGFQANWHGPYLNRHSRQLPGGYGELSVLYATGDRKATCTFDSDCWVWLVLENVPAKQWVSLNQTIDEGGGAYHEHGSDDIANGLLQADSAADPRMLFFRTVQRPE